MDAILEAIKKYYPNRVDDYLEGILYVKVVEVNDASREGVAIRRQMASTESNLVIAYDYGEMYI